MQFSTGMPWAAEFITAAQVERAGYRSSFYKAARAGRFHRVVPGVYLPSGAWAKLSADDRYLARVVAVGVGTPDERVYSHLSAAALWRLPMVNPWPQRAQLLVSPSTGGQSTRAFHAHADGIPADVVRIDDRVVTTLARTVVDVARTEPMSTAVAMTDFALRPLAEGQAGFEALRTNLSTLAEELSRHPSLRGRAKAAMALGLADGLSGSPGESLSRVCIHVLGLPAPLLQYEFVDDQGKIIVDFWWPEFNLAGEFDGFGKYRREEFLNGSTPAEAVYREKLREDRLRALGPRVARWGWVEAKSPPLLEARLRHAGLR